MALLSWLHDKIYIFEMNTRLLLIYEIILMFVIEYGHINFFSNTAIIHDTG